MKSDLHIGPCIFELLCFTWKIWFDWFGMSGSAVSTILSLRTVHWIRSDNNMGIWTYRVIFKADHQVFGVYIDGFLKWTWVTITRHTRPEWKTHHNIVMYVLDDGRLNSDDHGTTGDNDSTRRQNECKWGEGYIGSAHDISKKRERLKECEKWPRQEKRGGEWKEFRLKKGPEPWN